MSVLTVAQQVALKIGLEQPDALVTSTEREHIELSEILQDAAEQIAFDSDHDWQLLNTLRTETGDGSTSTYSLPPDFHDFVRGGQIWTSRLQYPLRLAETLDVWLEIEIRNYDYVTGVWIKTGDQIQVKPTPEAGEELSYYYQSKLIFAPAVGANLAAFAADTDTFRLSERLLKLCAIWLWKAEKGLPYEEDMEIYQGAMAREVLKDAPSRVLAVGRKSRLRGAKQAYPESLS